MIKVETLGMLNLAKSNPVIKSEKAVENYSFLTHDKDIYLIANMVSGDNAYRNDVVFPAGELLNGYLLKAWEGQKLVIDGKHVTGGIASITVGTVLVPGEDGKLKTGDAAGVHLVVTDVKVRLTEAAIKAKVVVA